MNNNPRIGVFLCQCGKEIAPFIDLNYIKDSIRIQVDHCEILPHPCLAPGIESIMNAASEKHLNRIIIAGCEARIMLKKFEAALEPFEILKGQVDMINLRSHVAAVSDRSPLEKARKAAKLIKGSIAELKVLKPTEKEQVILDGPVAVVGGGVASFTAVQKLIQAGVECILSIETIDPDQIIRTLHEFYPGERPYYDRLKKIITSIDGHKKLTIVEGSRMTELTGITGDYNITLEVSKGKEKTVKAGVVIAALDARLSAPGPEFGYDGQTVLVQSDMEEYIYQNGSPKGNVVFWISDYEYGAPEQAELSARSAWNMARYIKECSSEVRATIFFNQQMHIPLTGTELGINRRLDISWIPYDEAVCPTVQDGFITYCNLKDHIEHEMAWDYLILSPIRGICGNARETARVLGLIHKEAPFLTGHHAKVRPEMIGREETYLVGSARYPCDLAEALNQGKRAGAKNIEMLEKARKKQLFIPRTVCAVDSDKCVGCGQCQELCDCGGIGVGEFPSGGLPRLVDPMICTGGGTCAAACPYNALVLKNNTTEQREARISALAKELAPNEVISLACVWGGLPAADNAHHRKLKYNPSIHIIGVPCVGQINPSVLARAFLDGAPGLILIGCIPEECHHSFGVDHAWNRVNLIKKLFSLCGFDRRRIALAHADLNKPEEFVKTVNAFTDLISTLGPIERTRANLDKLESIYQLCKYNSRIRTLVSAALRRPWEKTYRGEQRHALEYDRDFTKALEDEFDYPESALFEPAESGKIQHVS